MGAHLLTGVDPAALALAESYADLQQVLDLLANMEAECGRLLGADPLRVYCANASGRPDKAPPAPGRKRCWDCDKWWSRYGYERNRSAERAAEVAAEPAQDHRQPPGWVLVAPSRPRRLRHRSTPLAAPSPLRRCCERPEPRRCDAGPDVGCGPGGRPGGESRPWPRRAPDGRRRGTRVVTAPVGAARALALAAAGWDRELAELTFYGLRAITRAHRDNGKPYSPAADELLVVLAELATDTADISPGCAPSGRSSGRWGVERRVPDRRPGGRRCGTRCPDGAPLVGERSGPPPHHPTGPAWPGHDLEAMAEWLAGHEDEVAA